jgi:hypothetical protein
MDPVRKAIIARFEAEGFVFEEVCDFSDGGQIKWQSKFDEIEKELGYEIGFDEFMACNLRDYSICFTSVRNSKVLYFSDFDTTDELIDASKEIIEKFYRDL